MVTWVVIYQTNTGFVYGLICTATSVSDVETEFWRAMETATGKTIKCIAELESNVLGQLVSLYEMEAS